MSKATSQKDPTRVKQYYYLQFVKKLITIHYIQGTECYEITMLIKSTSILFVYISIKILILNITTN